MWGQLLTTHSNAIVVAQWEAPTCSRPQPATYNSVRDDRYNWLAFIPPPYTGQYPLSSTFTQCKCGQQIARLAAATGVRTRVVGYGMPTNYLCFRKFNGNILLKCKLCCVPNGLVLHVSQTTSVTIRCMSTCSIWDAYITAGLQPFFTYLGHTIQQKW